MSLMSRCNAGESVAVVMAAGCKLHSADTTRRRRATFRHDDFPFRLIPLPFARVKVRFRVRFRVRNRVRVRVRVRVRISALRP